ncbi:MAG TPA: hypothetical protein VFR99_11020 [Marmoricola sp.]|nr:hypothetical protein [Marmoricola sp.]
MDAPNLPRRPLARPYRWSFAGMGGMAVLLFLDLGTLAVVPWWVTVLFVLLWLALFAAACRWFLRHPALVPLLPLAGFVVWVATVLSGVHAFGWRWG